MSLSPDDSRLHMSGSAKGPMPQGAEARDKPAQDTHLVQLRTYEPGDELEIVKLWGADWDREKAVRHWNWRYAENPYGPPMATVAICKETGDLVSTFSQMPAMLNLKGTPVPAMQPGDLIVHPRFQQQGLFYRVVAKSVETRQEEIELIYGFPNQLSYPGFMRFFSGVRLLLLKEYAYRLSIYQQACTVLRCPPVAWLLNFLFTRWVSCKLRLRRYLLRRQAGEVFELRRSQTLPGEYKKLWRKIRGFEILSIWKDSKYLQWRYDRKPESRHEYFGLYSQGELLAMAVVTHDPLQGLMISELLVANRNALIAKLLIAEILCHFQGKKHSHLRFTGHDVGLFDEALEGFRRSVSLSKVMVAEALEKDSELDKLMRQSENWTICHGDTEPYY